PLSYTPLSSHHPHRPLPSSPTRRSSDLRLPLVVNVNDPVTGTFPAPAREAMFRLFCKSSLPPELIVRSVAEGSTLAVVLICSVRSEEHTSELQSLRHLVCRLLLEKKNIK